MKFLSSIIIYIFLFFFNNCTDMGEQVITNCNEEFDCNNECGGSAIIDDCDICNGNNQSCEYYLTEIQPIFDLQCINCHNSSHFSGLDLTTYTSTIKGGVSGDLFIKGNHSNSLIWQYVNNGSMPPGNNNLTSEQIDKIVIWINNE